MKKITQLLFITLLSTGSYAQKIQWEKSYGGKHSDYLMDVIATPDYGFILVGSSLSKKTGNKSEDNKGDLDYWIWKMKENGDFDWQKDFGGSGADFLKSIVLTRDAGFILAGTSSSNKGFDKREDSRGGDDFWIIKLNAAGDEEWQKTIGGSGQEKIQSIYQTRDGGFILGGSSSSNKSNEKQSDSFGNLDYWVVKLDSNGKIEWQKNYGGIYADELRSIEQTTDGGYILGGYSNSPISGNKTEDNKGIGDYWVVKINNKGSIEWQKTIGGDQDDQLSVVHQTYDKGYILGGNSNSNTGVLKTKSNQNGTDFWVLKLNERGDIVWQETYNFGNVDILSSLVENKDHTLLIGGFAKGELVEKKGFNQLSRAKTQKGTDDYIALKINEAGEELWSKIIGSDGEDVMKKVIETRDGGYLLAGTSNPVPSSSATGENGSNQSNKQNSLSKLQGNNKQVEQTKNDINNAIKEQTDAINKSVNDTAGDLTGKVKDALGVTENSPLKITAPTAGIGGSLFNGSDSLANNGGATNKKLPPSGDKSSSYGNFDFWVVKLKDEKKPEKIKLNLEASPNPTLGFTNIVIGYDFENGTATVVDLAGRQLHRFEITSPTVPIDLSNYPEGIYIVNIRTHYQGKESSEGVKIIRGLNKN